MIESISKTYLTCAVLLAAAILAACSSSHSVAAMSTPIWRGVEKIGLACRISSDNTDIIRAAETEFCAAVANNIRSRLSPDLSFDVLDHPDARLLEENRVTLVFHASLTWSDSAFQGYLLAVSSSQFRHTPGGPPGAVFGAPPSVAAIPQTTPQLPRGSLINTELKDIISQHVNKLLL